MTDPTYQVFLSHSSKDKDFVNELYHRLTRDGVSCFFDIASIRWGENWLTALEHALDQSKFVVFILSPDFCESEWVKIERTSSIADDPAGLKRKIRPLMFRSCRDLPTFPRFLRHVQALDVSTHEAFEKNYPQICRELGGMPRRNDDNSDRTGEFGVAVKSTEAEAKPKDSTLPYVLRLFSARRFWLLLGLIFIFLFELAPPRLGLERLLRFHEFGSDKPNQVNGQLLTTLTGHTGSIESATFSSDGQRILTASDDKTARVRSAATGEVLLILQGHADALRSAAFSPDERTIVTASWDHTARIWDAASGKQEAILQGQFGLITSAVFSPDGKHILTTSWDSTARLWDASNKRVIFTLHGHTDPIQCGSFSPDGQLIVTASNDQTARVWNASNGQLVEVLRGHKGVVFEAHFSPDGQRIATASGDHTAKLWQVSDGRLLVSMGHSNEVRSAFFSPNGQLVATTSEYQPAQIWNAFTGQLVITLEGSNGWVSHAEFSPDGQSVVAGGWGGSARIWAVPTGQLLNTLRFNDETIDEARFSRDGQRILTTNILGKTAKVWNAANEK